MSTVSLKSITARCRERYDNLSGRVKNLFLRRPVDLPDNFAYATAGHGPGIRRFEIIKRDSFEDPGSSGVTRFFASSEIKNPDEVDPALVTEKENLIIKLTDAVKPKKWQVAALIAAYVIPLILVLPPLLGSMTLLPFGLIPGVLFHAIYEAVRSAQQKHYFKQVKINQPEDRQAFVQALLNFEQMGEDVSRLYRYFTVKLKAGLLPIREAVRFIEEYKRRDEKSDLDKLAAAAAAHYSALSGKVNSQTPAAKYLSEILEELKKETNEKYEASIKPDIGKSFGSIGEALNGLKRLLSALKNPLVSPDNQKEIKREAERLALGLRLIVEGKKRYILFPKENSGRTFRHAEPLGGGSGGEVYRAWDLEAGVMRAVKIFKTNGDPVQDTARAQREIEVLTKLDNEHIIKILDSGVTMYGNQFAVYPLMELTLDKIIEKQPPDARGAAQYALQMLEGLKAAHAEGVAHRDLKPANIFVDEKEDALVIFDFDLAKDIWGAITSANTQRATQLMRTRVPLIGTDAYRAPEFMIFSYLGKKGLLSEENEIEAWLFKNDIYAAGCILYEMLTKIDPFKIGAGKRSYRDYAINIYDYLEEVDRMLQRGKTAQKIAAKLIAKQKAPPIDRRNIPRRLFKIILKAIAYDPQDRYQSVDDFIKDLNKYLKPFLRKMAA